MKLRLLSLFLALILVCLPLASCQPPLGADDTTPAVTATNPDESTPEVSTPDDPIPQSINISAIIGEDTLLGDVYDSAMQIADQIAALNKKPAPEILGASVAGEKDGAKIIIGNTSYGKNDSLTEILREKDGVLYRSGDDFFILGGVEGAMAAAGYFAENFADVLAFDDGEAKYFYGDYTVRSISINGISLAKYSLVLPNSAGPYAAHEVKLFQEYIKELAGYDLPIYIDKNQTASEYEILIGKTNRAESNTNVEFDDGQYSLSLDGSKVVCNGKNHMVGAGLSEILRVLPKDSTNVELNIDKTAKARTFVFDEAENAILMIGDGMGFNSVAATEKIGLIDKFFAFDMTNLGESKTNSLSGTTDSAAGATALSTGYKTTNGALGLDGKGRPVLNLRELAYTMGAKTAVITTDSITGATPGAFLVHNTSRNDTAGIQKHINELIAKKHIEYCKGGLGNNLLTELQTALGTISADGSNFFIMLEEAQIDWASHSNDFNTMYQRVMRFNSVIAYGMAFTVMNPDTVMIVTADHETGGIKYNSSTDSYYYTTGSHSNVNVPLCAMGAGTEIFNKAVENVEIAKFIAKIFGAQKFGQ